MDRNDTEASKLCLIKSLCLVDRSCDEPPRYFRSIVKYTLRETSNFTTTQSSGEVKKLEEQHIQKTSISKRFSTCEAM
ncbi:hypothetical protein N7523_002660 [Penicillium sp. IBT 18751x]|nr:hypothetical protein N7523_002660 [Penicillium sp. IBT 18751x]